MTEFDWFSSSQLQTSFSAIVLRRQREGGRRRDGGLQGGLPLLLLSFHLHFRVGGQCDESRNHSLSYQRLIHPLHQQLIRLDRASRDVT